METHENYKFAEGAVVCMESKLRGSVTVGSKTIVHPKASILADRGPIIIGESNIFEERSIVENSPKEIIVMKGPVDTILRIGDNNVFEVGCRVLAKSIGNNNVFESMCYVGPDAVIPNGCVIGAGVQLACEEELQDNTIITGSNYQKRVASNPPQTQSLQIEFLSKLLRNYHHVYKTEQA